MSEEQKFERLFKDVQEIKHAVIGNEQFGHRGLVRRVKELETNEKSRTIKIAGVTGIAIGAWTVFKMYVLGLKN